MHPDEQGFWRHLSKRGVTPLWVEFENRSRTFTLSVGESNHVLFRGETLDGEELCAILEQLGFMPRAVYGPDGPYREGD